MNTSPLNYRVCYATEKFSGISSQIRVDPFSLLRNTDSGSENNSIELEDLGNTINKRVLEPTKDFNALPKETDDDVPRKKYTMSVKIIQR